MLRPVGSAPTEVLARQHARTLEAMLTGSRVRIEVLAGGSAFGLASARDRDPGSLAEPVPLDCGIRLRGSIDLIERQGGGRLRVTDHIRHRHRLHTLRHRQIHRAARRHRLAAGRALVAGEQLDDLLADAGEVGAELDQHLAEHVAHFRLGEQRPLHVAFGDFALLYEYFAQFFHGPVRSLTDTAPILFPKGVGAGPLYHGAATCRATDRGGIGVSQATSNRPAAP